MAGALLLLAAAACVRRGEPAAASEISVVDMLPKAVVSAPSGEHVLVRTAAVGGAEKRAIFMHPDARAEFPVVPLGTTPSFSVSIALQDEVQLKAGDGVDFTVAVKLDDDAIVEVWSKYLDTRTNAGDRGWQPTQISLQKFAGQNVRLILITSSGSTGDTSFDWALWGEPRLSPGAR